VALGNPPADRLSVNDLADHLVTSLQEAYCDARKHLGRAAERTKRYYDCKSHPLAFKPGDLVYVFSPVGLLAGPQSGNENIPTRLRSCGKLTRLITRSERGLEGAVQIVHIDKLKPYLRPGLGDVAAR